ncbi:DUF6055 domain-containing protein [Chitinophaga horti]|uniref:DUF6055 domain-containing protein n=1 Tax=Chitinophaga horti TaxID=2920382 RepID=A0ABY6J8I5_9BACT|nr:DUF6055 domain-containing protein [Chitinophaga horti]UYQ95953.1 DUF6055 domain-containing protein [Chitinophaga horti]
MKKLLLIILFLSIRWTAYSKSVYYPTQFSSAPWNEWNPNYKYESTNFVIFWGAKVGANPATYADANLRFDPAAIAANLEASYNYFVNTVGFHDGSGKLGLYKMIIVMNDTYNGAGGPTGWAFGGAYDEMIGAMWIHPNATRDPYVIAHELAHAFQSQNRIDFKPTGGGFNNYEPAGFFWEAHANYMRCLQYPTFASDDLPRWLMTRHFHLASTRHHYSTFKWLMNIQQNFGGVNTVNRLWRESNANETAMETWRRISGWTQAQLCTNMYDYAKREVNFDYPAQGFGADIRAQINIYKTSAAENHWLWREHTILTQISATTNRYIVPKYMAPQDYGMNIIPLHPNCSSNTVHVKFKGHTEVNGQAGWRWGFVEVLSNGTTSVYGATQSSSDGEATYTLTNASSKLYLVVMGAPTAKHDYVWEPGHPRIHRYPYELRIENAMPEGYQPNFRADLKALYPGSAHPNGGGWVASTATVAASVYVGPKAVVVGTSNLTGSVTVNGTARLQNVTAGNSVSFTGNCNVYGGNYSGTAQVTDAAVLFNSTVSGNAIIKENGWGYGVTYGGSNVIVGGDAEIGSCSTGGTYLQTPHGNNGRNNCDGLGATHSSNIDINSSYSNFSDAQMAWTAIGCGGGPVPGNIAPLATATTSYVSPWETIAALNDGFTPANSNDKSNGAYGNWNNPNSTQWVQYTWPASYTISSVQVYWFDDNGGVLTPTTATLQYYNTSTNAWVNVGAVPLTKNAFNTLAVPNVTTDRLRINMLNTTQSTGLLEWRVTGTPASSLMSEIAVAPKVTAVASEAGLTVYPNPVQSAFQVNLTGFKPEEDVTISIFDVQGKVVFKQNVLKQRTVKLNKSQVAGGSGLFLINAEGLSGRATGKVILNR